MQHRYDNSSLRLFGPGELKTKGPLVLYRSPDIRVGRLRILGGPRFRILGGGGPMGGQIPSRHMTSY